MNWKKVVDDPKFDNTYKSKVELRRLLIQNSREQDNNQFEPVSLDQVKKTIKTMKKTTKLLICLD